MDSVSIARFSTIWSYCLSTTKNQLRLLTCVPASGWALSPIRIWKDGCYFSNFTVASKNHDDLLDRSLICLSKARGEPIRCGCKNACWGTCKCSTATLQGGGGGGGGGGRFISVLGVVNKSKWLICIFLVAASYILVYWNKYLNLK